MSAKRELVLTTLCALLCVVFLMAPGVAQAAEGGIHIREVDTESFPKVEITVAIDGEKEMTSNDVEVTENGKAVEGLKLENLVDAGEDVDVVLVIDTSGSMQGNPFASATAAALRFVTSLPKEIRVGVVSFSDRPKVVQGLTEDHDKVLAKLGTLKADGETALYDGIVTGSKLFVGSGQHNMIVLSDGGDTASHASLKNAAKAATDTGATLFTVGLTSGEFDAGALRELASQTDGRYAPSGTADLAQVYAGLATEFSNQYVVSYGSALTSGGEVSLAVSAAGGADSALILTPDITPPEPKNVGPVDPEPGQSPFAGETALSVGILMAFLAIFALAYMLLGQKARRRADEELSRRTAAAARAPEVTPDGDKGFVGWIPDSLVQAAEKAGEGSGINAKIDAKLERAGVSMRSGEFAVVMVVGGMAGFLLGLALLGNMLFGIILGGLAAWAPWLWMGFKIRRRHGKLQTQLPDILMILAGSLRAGHSFFEALDQVAKEIGDPGSEEFSRVVAEIRLGRSVQDSMNALAERIGSDDFKWALLAVNIQREVGGNLAEVLDTVAETMRERDGIRRQIDVLTAEGRLSMYILAGLPIVVAIYMSWVNPEYIGLLFNNGLGLLMTAVAGCLLAVGIVWMRKVVKIDV